MVIDPYLPPRSGVQVLRNTQFVLALFFCCFLLVHDSRGQQNDTLEVALPEVRISATRGITTDSSSPFSLLSVRREDYVVDSSPGISLEQTLRGIPGLFLSYRNHFAVGERIVIRGMGSRAPFGVRGVQVVLDGIPLTLPDGQSVADIVDPGMVSSVQLIRGPASVFWGNGSGGALFISTNRLRNDYPTRLRVQGGSFGLRQLSAESNFNVHGHSFRAFASSIRQDGYRDHSSGRFSRAAVFGRINTGARSVLSLVGAFADQRANHPGSLTQAQFDEDPTQANGLFQSRLAGKESRQVQIGTRLFASIPLGLVTASAHYVWRALRNPLPFAFIDLDRSAGGLDLSLQKEMDNLVWALGADMRFQNDRRENWNTVEGERGTDQSLDQTENVLNGSARAMVLFSPSTRVQLAAGARFDNVRFDTEDKLLSNGDDSGARTFEAISPVLGISYRFSNATLYADFGSAFETPTTTELVNRPDLSGGFNPDLNAQKTIGLEAGLRLRGRDGQFSADIAVYRLQIRDRLLAFQTEEGGDRTFFRNGGKNKHTGVEAAVRWAASDRILITASGSVGKFEFEDEEFKGNSLPGIPEQQFSMEAAYSPGDLRIRATISQTDSYYVDDANTVATQAFTLLDMNVTHVGIDIGGALLRPFLQVSNLLDEKYASAVSINSSSGSYFDPGSSRSLEAGINLLF